MCGYLSLISILVELFAVFDEKFMVLLTCRDVALLRLYETTIKSNNSTHPNINHILAFNNPNSVIRFKNLPLHSHSTIRNEKKRSKNPVLSCQSAMSDTRIPRIYFSGKIENQYQANA